jgi:phospholipid/cholesterol/gamma-HCH transport system ATP-binding protein
MIYAHDIWKSYRGSAVLKGLSLAVPKGKTCVILGRSGAGKSVLLRQIIGLEKPDTGYIEVDGLRISNMSQHDLYKVSKNFGMLFQSSALFDSMTVGENVCFYLKNHRDNEEFNKISDSQLEDMVEESLKKVGLPGVQKKLPSELSGGQKRRAALARLVIYKPKIMLYDEPTTGLDPITANQINDLIIQTHEELQATTIVVTHDIHSALDVGDLFALHKDGVIAFIDEKEQFIQSKIPAVRDFFTNAIINPKYQTLIEKNL